MLSTLADDFVRGDGSSPDDRLASRKYPYRAFELHAAVGVRPSALRYLLPLDDPFLKRVAASVARSPLAGQRLGRDWKGSGESRIETKESSDASWLSPDDLRPLNDVCTKWCSKTFFPDAFSRVDMVANVGRLYNRLRDLTKLKFDVCFKGGVMMRLVLLEFLQSLTTEGRVDAERYMNGFHALSLSDFDFEVVPRDHAPDEPAVLRFLALDYAVLLWLMARMQNEISSSSSGGGGLLHIGWDRAERTAVLRAHLQAEIDGFDVSHPLHKARVDRVVLENEDADPPKGYKSKEGRATPAPRRNVVIYKCDDTTCVLPAARYFRALGVEGVPVNAGRHLYGTLNTFIGEGEAKARKGHQPGLFHLSRIKHGFVVYYTTSKGERRCDRLGGELIDLSQSHGTRGDRKRREFYERVPHPYTSYPIVGVDARVVTLQSYSAHGFMEDLRTQLHGDADVPWESSSSKVSKRLLRYVAFLFLHVLGPDVPGAASKKLAAFRAATDATASVEALLSFRPATGVDAVNDFVRQEARTVREADRVTAKTRTYVRTLHKHLRKLVACYERPFRLYLDAGEADVVASQLLF